MRKLIGATPALRLLPLAALVAAVIVVLLHGGSRRRVSAMEGAGAEVLPPESTPALRADLEKTPLSYFSDYWGQLGNKVKSGLVLVGTQSVPALVVGPGLAVSTIDLAGELAAPGRGGPGDRPYHLLAADEVAGVALLELTSPAKERAFRRADPASLRPGMLVAAVTLDERGGLAVMPGHLISVGAVADPASAGKGSLEVSVPVTPSTRTAAVVDLDGHLVGALFRSRGTLQAVGAAFLLKMVERLRSHPTCHALEVADASEGVRALMGLDGGIVVERVHRESFRGEPSLRAGDVLLEWGGHKVSSAAEFDRLYDGEPPGTSVACVVRRGRRNVSAIVVMPGPDCRPLGDQPAVLARTGLTLAWNAPEGRTSPAWSVVAVAMDTPAQRAGVLPGDRIVGGPGSPSGRAPLLRVLEAFERDGRPVVLALERGERVKLVALPRERR